MPRNRCMYTAEFLFWTKQETLKDMEANVQNLTFPNCGLGWEISGFLILSFCQNERI